MTTQVSFTTDPSLKKKALLKARQEGITLKTILTYSLKAFVEGKIALSIITKEEPEVEEIIFNDKKINEKAKKLADLLS